MTFVLQKYKNVREVGDMQEKQNSITIHTDGGSRGNPGQAAIGVVITRDTQELVGFGKTIGVATNNEAEYQAVIEAFRWLVEHKQDLGESSKLAFYLDSELVGYQLTGKYQVKNERMKPLYETVQRYIQSFHRAVTFTIIPREYNAAADAQVNAALDGTSADSKKPYAKRNVYAKHKSFNPNSTSPKLKKNWY
jgi:ribonuclease HI